MLRTRRTTVHDAKLARLRRLWYALVGELHDPDVELTMEEFAALLSVYKRLQLAGHRFDPATAGLMAVLERQASDTLDALEDDTDSDDDLDESLNNSDVKAKLQPWSRAQIKSPWVPGED